MSASLTTNRFVFASAIRILSSSIMVLSLIIISLGAYASARAAIVPTGIDTIEGQISYPNGHRVGQGLPVALSNLQGAHMSASTDDTGKFRFNPVFVGNYRLRIDAGQGVRVS